MENKEIAQPQKVVKHERVEFAKHGSQIVFRNTDHNYPFRPHVHYVVDTERWHHRKRRAKSLETKVRTHNPASPTSAKKDADLLKDVVIEIDRDPNEENKNESQSPTLSPSRARSKWTVLRSVLRAVSLFRRNEAEIINNEEELDRALESYQCNKSRAYSYICCRTNNFEEHFKEERLYELIAKGSPTDIHEIDEILHKDRKTYLHDLSDANSLLNAPNRAGRTPLYIATQNGNFGMVKYLISRQANPLIKSKVSPAEEESNLTVASRWKHAKILEFYLAFYDWPYEELRKAKKAAGNPAVKETIVKHMAIIRPKACCWFCRPAKKQNKKK